MKHILVTGSSGFLGQNIIKNKPIDWQITGAYLNTPLNHPEVNAIKVNLTQTNEIEQLINTRKFDGVIHLAALSHPNYCQQNPAESFAINVIATKHLAELCSEKSIPMVFTSTDLVFDGKKGNYSETDTLNPLSLYGEQKVEAEEVIQKIYPDAAICRMPLMFGLNGSFLPGFLNRIKKGETLNLFTDEYRSVLGGISAAKGLMHALFNFKGTYHLGGLQSLSRYDFGIMMRDYLDIPTANIVPAKQADFAFPAPRPTDVTLDSTKANNEGFKPLPAHIELSLLKRELV